MSQVVFGELKDGKSIVRKIENLPTQSDKPTKDVVIVGMASIADVSCAITDYIIQIVVSYRVTKHRRVPRKSPTVLVTYTRNSQMIRMKNSKVLRSLRLPPTSKNMAIRLSKLAI